MLQHVGQLGVSERNMLFLLHRRDYICQCTQTFVIAWVSFSLSPSVLVCVSRSEPARSTRLSVCYWHLSWKIEWDLDERSLHAVSAVTLYFSDCFSSEKTLLASLTLTQVGSYLLACALEVIVLVESSRSLTESK